MRIFSKILVICNGCFLLAVLLRLVEQIRHKPVLLEGTVFWNPLTSTVVILGYGAIFLNLIFFLFIFLGLVFTRKFACSRSIFLFNLLVFFGQVLYFFF